MRTLDFTPLRSFITFLLLVTSRSRRPMPAESPDASSTVGALVPGAKVELIQDGKPVAEAVSDEKGSFHFVSLATGRYAVRASASGFRAQETASVIVRATGTANTEITLPIGAIFATSSCIGNRI